MTGSEGTKKIDTVVMKQIQTATNRRLLRSMPSFGVDQETPDAMVDLLRRMEMAEVRAARRHAD
jgi:hypothetical protein